LVVGRRGKERRRSGEKVEEEEVPKKQEGRRRGRGTGVLSFRDDYDYGIKQVAGNDDYDDDDEGRYLFSFDSLFVLTQGANSKYRGRTS